MKKHLIILAWLLLWLETFAFAKEFEPKNEPQDIEITHGEHLALSPDGKTLVVWPTVINLITGKRQKLEGGKVGGGTSFSPNGQYFMKWGTEGIHLWKMGETITELNTPSPDVNHWAAFSPDSKSIFFEDPKTGDITQWSIDKEQESDILKINFSNSSSRLNQIDITPTKNGDLFAFYWDQDRMFYVFMNGSKKTSKKFELATTGERLLALRFLPGQDKPISLDTSGRIQQWNPETLGVKTLIEVGEGDNPARSLVVSPNATLMAIGFQNGTIQIREIALGKIVSEFRRHKYGVDQMAFSPDSRKLYSLDWDIFVDKKFVRVTAVPTQK